MNTLQLYGAHFLEALAIYLVQLEPAKLWLTLGPREVIIKQIVENLYPDLPVQMFQPHKGDICFDPHAAYIFSSKVSWLKTLVPNLLEEQPFILALLCEQPEILHSYFAHSKIHSDVINSFSDLANHFRNLQRKSPQILLIDTSTLSTTGDLIIDWQIERTTNINPGTPSKEIE